MNNEQTEAFLECMKEISTSLKEIDNKLSHMLKAKYPGYE